MKKQHAPKQPKSPIQILDIPASELKHVVGGQAPKEEQKK